MWPSNNASTILVNIVHAVAAPWEWNVAIWNSSLMWMSICLSLDFSALCGSPCLRCRITGSGQLVWRTAKIPPVCLHHKHGLFSVLGHTKVKPSISVAKGIIYKNVDSVVFFCIDSPQLACVIPPLGPQPRLYSACENGQRSSSATQPQLVLSSKRSGRGSSIWRWGERGSDSLCITPAKAFLRASGCALHTRGLLLFSLHHLFSHGHRLPSALELFHNSQTLLALQAKQQ